MQPWPSQDPSTGLLTCTFLKFFVIQLKLLEECSSFDGFMKKIVEQMFMKFNKYWSEFNILLAITMVFDPRYKFQFLEFSYQNLYGPGSAELTKVMDTLFSLFNEYVRVSKKSQSSSLVLKVEMR